MVIVRVPPLTPTQQPHSCLEFRCNDVQSPDRYAATLQYRNCTVPNLILRDHRIVCYLCTCVDKDVDCKDSGETMVVMVPADPRDQQFTCRVTLRGISLLIMNADVKADCEAV